MLSDLLPLGRVDSSYEREISHDYSRRRVMGLTQWEQVACFVAKVRAFQFVPGLGSWGSKENSVSV